MKSGPWGGPDFIGENGASVECGVDSGWGWAPGFFTSLPALLV